MKKYVAEFIGTFWLVLGGCGSAVLAATFPDVGIGLLGVSLAFGLTVLTMAFAIGHISGCHLNPAVSFGLWAGGRFPAKELLPYIVAQVVGAVVAGGVLFLIASGKPGFDASAGFASNGYGEHSPGGYSLLSALVAEIAMTMMFLLVILGATDKRAPQGFAPIAIGLCLTLIHLVSIPVTNTSVNPARSTGVAVFAGGWAIAQLWLSPRLQRVRQQFPNQSISINALEQAPNLKREICDISLFFGQPTGAKTEQVLGADVIFPVCAPALAAQIANIDDLQSLPRIYDATWVDDWRLWLKAAGAQESAVQSEARFSLYSLALQEARNGAGVMIGHASLVERDLASGALVAPFDVTAHTGKSLILQTLAWPNAETRMSKIIEALLS